MTFYNTNNAATFCIVSQAYRVWQLYNVTVEQRCKASQTLMQQRISTAELVAECACCRHTAK